MRNLSALAAVIEAEVKEAFNDGARALLKPMRDGERFFLSSDICVRLARRFGRDPGAMAQQILSKIVAESTEVWSHHAGYINIVSPQEREEFEHLDSPEASSVVVYVPLRPAGVSESSMARLVALATLQYWMARKRGWDARLYCGHEEISVSQSTEIRTSFLSLLHGCLRERPKSTHVERDVLDLFAAQRERSCTFFLCPGDVGHTLWRQGGALAGFDERAHIHIPDRGWMADVDRLPESFDYLESASAGMLALVLHLVDAQRGVDVDWNMPLFHERGNLAWAISSVHERMRRLEGGLKDLAPKNLHNWDTVTAGMAFTVRYLDAYGMSAARDGEISAFIDALRLILNGALSALNDPEKRIALAQGSAEIGALFRWMGAPIERINAFFYID